MEMRQRILDAAARVYSHHGFRGATTRLIAAEADVNEVTLFRTFGSKEALFDELVRHLAANDAVPQLPEVPKNPEDELTAWTAAVLGHMRSSRGFIRQAIGELEARPDTAVISCKGVNFAGGVLAVYARRLREWGFTDHDGDINTGVAMLMSVLFADAIVPNALPEPTVETPRRYVRGFLRVLGVRPSARARHAPRARRTS